MNNQIDYEAAIATIQTAHKNEIQEMQNRIASALKYEYIDFKTIDETTEHNEALCDNLIDQMQSIFKILKKNGIDIESRL